MKFKNEKGITMITLVVLMIVMVIIAGVAIASLTGDDGLIKNARKVVQNMENEQKEGLNEMEEAANQLFDD